LGRGKKLSRENAGSHCHERQKKNRGGGGGEKEKKLAWSGTCQVGETVAKNQQEWTYPLGLSIKGGKKKTNRKEGEDW